MHSWFFVGSLTTCQAAEQLGRRWVGIDLFLRHLASSVFRFDEIRLADEFLTAMAV